MANRLQSIIDSGKYIFLVNKNSWQADIGYVELLITGQGFLPYAQSKIFSLNIKKILSKIIRGIF